MASASQRQFLRRFTAWQPSGTRGSAPITSRWRQQDALRDTVVVVALDRLGRCLSSVIRTVERLTAAGVMLRSLREGIDYSTPTGRMLAGIFAALSEYERELMHERAAAARQVRALRQGGESVNDLGRTFGVSRATVHRALEAAELADVEASPAVSAAR